MNIEHGCKDVSIYLGNSCNFNCSYCDRDYIKDDIGGQKLVSGDTVELISFMQSITQSIPELKIISFHGGEPFVYIKQMDEVLDNIVDMVRDDCMFFIQTNGSLIENNAWFFEKWGERLVISISYDFMFQELNRTSFDIKKAIDTLKTNGVQDIQFQYVMPIQNPKVFSLTAVQNILDVCYGSGVTSINIIPLRHIRGKTKFEVIVDNIDLPQFFDAFLRFIQILYIKNIHVVIDGQEGVIDKHYFNDHKQMVLSPDGYIYPEYDFLEYKIEETRIGQWKGESQLYRNIDEEGLMLDVCKTCSARDTCGLKYLYKQFDKVPEGSCKTFYTMLETIIKHTTKLQTNKSIFHWIGI